MAQSDSLRKRTDQHKPKNNESKLQDIKIKNVIDEVQNTLEKKYPKLSFGWQKKITNEEIISTLPPDIPYEEVLDSTFIMPDGGFLFVLLNGKEKYICISEQKKQGTNDQRIQEGKDRQGLGNAVERIGKNLNGMKVLHYDEDILPFVAFLQGCDFHSTETIPDRVKTCFEYLPMNKINLYKDRLNRAGSYFMKGHHYQMVHEREEWSFSQMYETILSISEQSLEYYITKYGVTY